MKTRVLIDPYGIESIERRLYRSILNESQMRYKRKNV